MSTWRRLAPFGLGAALLALTVVVWACGGDDAGGSEGRDLNRCSLVTTQEAGQWIGAPVEAAPSEGVDGDPDPVTCLYEGTSAKVLLQVYDGEVYFAEPGSAARTGETIEDLGEDAWMRDDKVAFLQNDWSVSLAQITGQVSADQLLEMAQVVSANLP